MSESFKVCPICDTPNHHNATVCTTCGTDLSNVTAVSRKRRASGAPATQDYDFRYGETDLLEGTTSGRANVLLIVSVTFVLALLLGGVGAAFLLGYFDPVDADAEQVVSSPTASATLNIIPVTQGPPTITSTFTPSPSFTPSITPTRSPCTIQIQTGGTLTGALLNCGHRSLDVLPTVLALNGISDSSQVSVGQVLEIPWPTATIDPFAPTATPQESSNNQDGVAVADAGAIELDESIDAFAPTATPILPAGIQWHQVQQNENIISIVTQYNADVKTLSELNREIDFARCDFGMTFGGPECIVQLFQGQFLRVPAPSPTPTLSPTPDPNATATPTPTATFNVPTAFSPSDQEFFYKDELVTLRWIPSATLTSGESYRVDVQDVTTGERYVALTQEISFTIPFEWQGTQNNRHEFMWSVGIVSQDQTDDVRYQTAPLAFVWEGLPESE